LSHEGCTPSNVLFIDTHSDYEDNNLLLSSELELNNSKCKEFSAGIKHIDKLCMKTKYTNNICFYFLDESIKSCSLSSTKNNILIHVDDPINPLSSNRLEFNERIGKGPYRPILEIFLRQKQGSCMRSFQKSWYDLYDWLEYSPTADAAFCFPCRCFSGNEKNCSQLELTFSTTGLKVGTEHFICLRDIIYQKHILIVQNLWFILKILSQSMK